LLVAAVLAGGGLLWWSSRLPPPGDPDLVDPANVYPVTLPAGYAPPIDLDEDGQFSVISHAGPSSMVSRRTIETDGSIEGRAAVEICVIPPGGDPVDCAGRFPSPVRIETSYKGTRVVISPVDRTARNLDEWRGITFTSDYNEMSWLGR
jgi:hypothetical protein